MLKSFFLCLFLFCVGCSSASQFEQEKRFEDSSRILCQGPVPTLGRAVACQKRAICLTKLLKEDDLSGDQWRFLNDLLDSTVEKDIGQIYKKLQRASAMPADSGAAGASLVNALKEAPKRCPS